MVFADLGDDPRAYSPARKTVFAAASLGRRSIGLQHQRRGRAVKIRHPGIARTIQSDFRNLFLFLLPARLTGDWESTKDQCDDLRVRLEQETDYALEATYLERARALFREADGIVVPRVYPQFSTKRMLTMDRRMEHT
jgi:predicted unusual protein kinase regulating ubiquinone biosynthesis (AarF/ABC1/UbiB family)